MAGLLDRMAANPLTQVGMGLLSQGPSLLPINPWQGVQRGLLSAQDARAEQEQRAQQQNLMQMRQQQMQMEMQAQQQKAYESAQARARQAAAAQYLEAGDADKALSILNPEQSAMKQIELANADPKEYKTIKGADGFQYWASGPNSGQRVLPGVEKAPEEMTAYQRAQIGLERDKLNAEKGTKGYSAMTPEQGAALNIPEDRIKDYMVNNKDGKPILIPQSDAAENEMAEGEVTQKLSGLMNDYLQAGKTGSSFVPGGSARADQLKLELAWAIARKREPTGKLTNEDIEVAAKLIPDAFGTDSFTFEKKMKALSKLWRS